MHFQPRANLVTAVAGVAGQMLVEPLSDAISDNIIFPLMEQALGRDIPSAAEIRRREQQGEQVRSLKDAAIETPSQTLLEALVPPLKVIDDADRQYRIQRRYRRLWMQHHPFNHIHHLHKTTNAIVNI